MTDTNLCCGKCGDKGLSQFGGLCGRRTCEAKAERYRIIDYIRSNPIDSDEITGTNELEDLADAIERLEHLP